MLDLAALFSEAFAKLPVSLRCAVLAVLADGRVRVVIVVGCGVAGGFDVSGGLGTIWQSRLVLP
ncbi:MAG: hypothetical protein ABEN55_02875, partial [Bradymonadaceae bacterium]